MEYVVQTATDLANPNWLSVLTNVTGQIGTFPFSYDQPADETPRFFRALSSR